MPRNGFRTEIFRRALHRLDAEDRALMTATLDEIDHGDMQREDLSLIKDVAVRQWDACLVSIFNEGVYIQHWTRPLDGKPVRFLDMHGTARRLNGHLPTVEEAKSAGERVMHVAKRSAIGTVAFLVIGETEDGRRQETLWWHPSLTKSQALIVLDSMVHYALEENEPS